MGCHHFVSVSQTVWSKHPLLVSWRASAQRGASLGHHRSCFLSPLHVYPKIWHADCAGPPGKDRDKDRAPYVLASLRDNFPTFFLQFLYQAWQMHKEKLQWSPAWRYFRSQCLVWTNNQTIKKKLTIVQKEIFLFISITLVEAYRLQLNNNFIPVFCFRTDPIRVQTFPGLNKPCTAMCRRCADMWEWRDVLKI